MTYADGIDIGLVTRKRLAAHAVANVPQFGRSVASARDESAEVGRQRERHDVARVSSVRSRLRARLYVPQCAAIGKIRNQYHHHHRRRRRQGSE